MRHSKPIRTTHDAMNAAYRNWERVYSQALSGNLDSVLMVRSMEWCLSIDAEILQMNLADYLHGRKGWLIDPDKPSGDVALDTHYNSLRRQYQDYFGKDVVRQ